MKFWNLNFRLADIESTDYVDHGTVFFSTPKNELSRAFQSWPNLHFMTFLLKMANICHYNIKFKYVPEK